MRRYEENTYTKTSDFRHKKSPFGDKKREVLAICMSVGPPLLGRNTLYNQNVVGRRE